MTRWFPMQPPADDVFDTATVRIRHVVTAPVEPDVVWRSLTSDESLAAWGPGIRSVRWTSPRPFGTGTTREVVLPAGLATVRERFDRWEEGVRYAFHGEASNRPGIRTLAEDYLLEPTADGTRLTWRIAIEPVPAAALPVRLLGPLVDAAFGRMARDGERYFRRRSGHA